MALPADPFLPTFGDKRGQALQVPLLGAGPDADKELERLISLVNQGSYGEVKQVIETCVPELAVEVHKTGSSITDLRYWDILQECWPTAMRLSRGEGNRVERLLAYYTEQTEKNNLLKETDFTRRLPLAFEALGMIPDEMTRSEVPLRLYQASLAFWIHLHLSSLVIDNVFTSAEIERDGNWEALNAFGTILADWTIREGWEQTLPHILGEKHYQETCSYLEDIDGKRLEDWLGPKLMPFDNWSSFFSGSLYGCESFTEAAIEKFREEMETMLIGLPEAIHG